ncbi:MAG: hypothetical protein PHV33_10730 [Elusimicrobiales bacterium]|nr:hypothetical protein [Elusimicrobiales bacterium]
MLTKGALEDLIMQHLRPAPGAVPAVKKVPALKKRIFISDWELRRLYTPGARMVSVPANAILSPLSLDWLDYDGVKVLRV